MKNLSIIILATWFCSCNGQAKSPEPTAPFAAVPVLNAPAALSPTEMRHYQTEVTHFVDSVFTHHPFNGSILVAKNGEVIFERLVSQI